jgi:hypothetical protein
LDGEPIHRESPLYVARRWLPWCLALIFALTIGWTALIAWVEVSDGKHDGVVKTVIAVVSGTAPASPLILVYAILIISVIDILGGLIVVTARYLGNKFIAPLIEKRRAEGQAQERRRWTEWNLRRLEAEASGVLFDEPPPGPVDTPHGK